MSRSVCRARSMVMTLSFNKIPLQLQDEKRRDVARLDAPGINPPQHQGLEVFDARGADHLRAEPSAAFAAHAAAATAFTRHHGDRPAGLTELPRGGYAFSRLADNHRMPISN